MEALINEIDRLEKISRVELENDPSIFAVFQLSDLHGVAFLKSTKHRSRQNMIMQEHKSKISALLDVLTADDIKAKDVVQAFNAAEDVPAEAELHDQWDPTLVTQLKHAAQEALVNIVGKEVPIIQKV